MRLRLPNNIRICVVYSFVAVLLPVVKSIDESLRLLWVIEVKFSNVSACARARFKAKNASKNKRCFENIVSFSFRMFIKYYFLLLNNTRFTEPHGRNCHTLIKIARRLWDIPHRRTTPRGDVQRVAWGVRAGITITNNNSLTFGPGRKMLVR